MLERARLAQSVEHQTFNLRVAGSSPSSGEQVSSFFYLTQRLSASFSFYIQNILFSTDLN